MILGYWKEIRRSLGEGKGYGGKMGGGKKYGWISWKVGGVA